LENLKCKLF